MIPNAGHQTLMSIIRKKVHPDSIVYSVSWHAYAKLDVSEFHLFLAECEWRFNIRAPAKLLKILT